MKEIPPINTANMLKQYGLRADKKLGQNFLQDPIVLESIVAAAEIRPTDIVLEIGPGLGSLTRYLAIAARQVIAVELDADLIPILRAVLKPFDNVQLIHGDILKLAPKGLVQAQDYLVVANIPYYITSAIIRHLLETEPKPHRFVLTVQKEVADRICAGPGDMSLLALSVQVYGKPRIVKRIPASAFFPAPKVESSVLCVEIYPTPKIQAEFLDIFFKLVKSGFSQKRKMLRNSLSAGLQIASMEAESMLARAGIDPKRRAETLTLDEWQKLCGTYKDK